MAEFALIAPVFLLLVVGLLVFGRLFFYWIQTNHVANETARWAVVDRNPYLATSCGGTPTGAAPCQTLQQKAKSTATNEFEDSAQVCIDFPEGKTMTTVEPGDAVRVRVHLPVSFVGFFGWGVTIKGSATMRVERLENNVAPQNYDTAENLGSCA